MNENMKLWNQVQKTDPDYTIDVTEPRKMTSISPMYRFMRATEVFGVQGIGWGVIPESERFEERQIGETVLLSYDAILFFDFEGKRGEIPIHATERLAYKTRTGYLKIDDDARKKVVTNAKTKGLSELGFSADIFLGEFDDPKYIEDRRSEVASEQDEKARTEREASIEEFKLWCKAQADQYKTTNRAALKLKFKSDTRKIENKCSELKLKKAAYISQLENHFNNRLAELEQ